MCCVNLKKTEAKHIIKHLLKNGYRAYFVGGYVRDLMLKREIHDIDIATSALPAEVIKLFTHTVPTGLQHGTVTVIENNIAFEVTTFRTDSKYDDHRRPTEVQFIDDLYEDLKRRDFTMNAMAMDLEESLIDPFDGLLDLNRKILRCVGDPSERFEEDALRMMRCIRFASNYELSVESATWEALILHRTAIQYIAMERIRIELEKIIEGSSPHKGIELLVESRLMEYFKVDLGISYEALQELLKYEIGQVLSRLQTNRSKWALYFIGIRRSAWEVRDVLRKLTFSNDKMKEICRIIEFHEWFVRTDQTEVDWKTGSLLFGYESVLEWHRIMKILDPSHELLEKLELVPASLVVINEHGLEWIEDLPVRDVKDLQISGRDLLSLGRKPGPWMGNVLQRLLTDTALQRVANEHLTLINHAKMVMKELKDDE